MFTTQRGWEITYGEELKDKCCGLFYGCGFKLLVANIALLTAILVWVGLTSIVLFYAIKVSVTALRIFLNSILVWGFAVSIHVGRLPSSHGQGLDCRFSGTVQQASCSLAGPLLHVNTMYADAWKMFTIHGNMKPHDIQNVFVLCSLVLQPLRWTPASRWTARASKRGGGGHGSYSAQQLRLNRPTTSHRE